MQKRCGEVSMERRRGREEEMEVGGVREGSRLGEKERRRERD